MHWILVKVSDKEASQRMQQRQDHFHKGREQNIESGGDCSTVDAHQGTLDSVVAVEEESDDNREWKFAPVTFEHIILDGTLPIEVNAYRVVQIIQSILQNQLS